MLKKTKTLLENSFLLPLFLLIPAFTSAQIRNHQFKEKLNSIYKHTVPLIAIEDFKALDKRNLYVLDTREEEEFNVSHLKNARHVGYFWFDMRKVYDIPLDATVVLYCAIGDRSEKIGEKLIHYGYKHVYNLYGSIFEWVNQGNPVYKSNGIQTSEIHIHNQDFARWVERGSKVD